MGIVIKEGESLFRNYSIKKYKTLRGAKCALTRLLKLYSIAPEYHAKLYHEAYISIDGMVFTVLRSNGYGKYIITTP